MGTRGLSVAFAAILLCTCASGQTILDTVYTPAGYDAGPQSATVYMPKFPNGTGVVLVHGVGLMRGFLSRWCDTLAAHGYTAMTIDYNAGVVSDLGVYPKPVRALKTAVQFLRRSAARFNITAGRIVGVGFSAGAIYMGESITWDNDYKYFRTDSTVSDHLDAAVLFYGLYDTWRNLEGADFLQIGAYFGGDTTLRGTRGNTIANVGAITSPVLLFHGTSDPRISYKQSVQLHDSLRAHGKPSQLVLGPWLHGFDVGFRPEGLAAKDTVLAYLQRTVTGVEQHVATIVPEHFVLEQNYPNPFNPSTTIRYSVPHREHITLAVFTALGQQVATLVNGDIDAGYHEVQFNANSLAGGMYFYRLQAGSYTETRKLLLMK